MQGGVEKGTRRADSMPQRPRAGWGLIAAWCLNAALVCAENKVGPRPKKREKCLRLLVRCDTGRSTPRIAFARVEGIGLTLARPHTI